MSHNYIYVVVIISSCKSDVFFSKKHLSTKVLTFNIDLEPWFHTYVVLPMINLRAMAEFKSIIGHVQYEMRNRVNTH